VFDKELSDSEDDYEDDENSLLKAASTRKSLFNSTPFRFRKR
jgi:hypothetical protein